MPEKGNKVIPKFQVSYTGVEDNQKRKPKV
jgi:hypothetical protein